MKLFLRKCSFFLVFVAIFYSSLLLIYNHVHIPEFLKGNLPAQSIHKLMFSELKNTRDIDILFIGPSHCYRGFDPRFFKASGYTSFNLGTISQTPLQAKYMLREYISKLNPKTVVYEVYPRIFSNQINLGEPAIAIIANESPKKYLLSIAFDSRDIRAYNKLAANYLSDLLFKEKNDSIKRWGSDVYIGNGFVEKDLAYNRTKQPNMRTLEFNARQFRAFEEILSLLKQKKIKTILVYAPVSPKLYHSFTNNAEFDKKMKAYGEYYNFNELVEMDNVLDFYDADHMNKNGVAKFNKKLISVLDSVGALKTNY